MLIACTSCGSKIRVPDGMAGKKGKCPKCGLVFTIPEALEIPDTPAAAPPPADIGITSAPPTSDRGTPPPATPPPKSAAEPPPVPSRRAWEDDEDEDDRDRRRSRRPDRGDRDDDDDDDYDDIRRRLRRKPEESGLSLSSMIVGIVSASLGVGAICCWIILAPLAFLGGVVAVILGFMGKSRGGESQAITGIVLGFVAIGLSVLWMLCGIFWMGANILGGGLR